MMRSGGRAVTVFQRDVAARDDLGFRVGDTLERVLNQAGDILFVLDD